MNKMAGFVVGMHSLTKELADIFAEDSEDDVTFYGFSDTELKDTILNSDYEGQPVSPKEKEIISQPAAGPQPFRLRVALRSASSAHQSTDYEDGEDDEKIPTNTLVKRPRGTRRAKMEKLVKSEDETAVTQPSPSEELHSDSAEDVADNFLAKREQNIKANKMMLAHLMADLQKMPGGAEFLKNQTGKQKTKVRTSRPPRSGVTRRESRRNPERASRRRTRSMVESEDPAAPQEADLELSLEDELLEVRHAPLRRGGALRPNQSKPHVIRPVEDITEDELRLVADNMTDKVYNSVTGSTCHQCRQKTVDTKTCCRSEDCRGIQGQFCGPCLRNRYGEDVRKVLLNPEWKCPPCRGICNCSFCRQREGRCPTGILFPLAQYHGFSDVHSYLSSLRNKLKSDENVEM